MIEDYVDRNRTIKLGRMRLYQAVDYLMARGVHKDAAFNHVVNSIHKWQRNGMTVDEGIQYLKNAGFNQYTAYNNVSSYVYDKVSIQLPENSIVQLNLESSMWFRNIELRITTKTVLTLWALQKLLAPKGKRIYPPIETHHDWRTEMNSQDTRPSHRITIYFDDDEKVMVNLLAHIFSKLHSFCKSHNVSVDFTQPWFQALHFVREFCRAREADFPGGNYCLRKLQPIDPISEPEDQHNPQLLKLYKAIENRSTQEVSTLLRNGVRADSRFNSYPMIGYCLSVKNEDSIDTLIRIFTLLLDYGAQIDRGFNGYNSTSLHSSLNGSLLSAIIFKVENEAPYWNRNRPPNRYHAYELLLGMIMIIDNGRTPSYVNSETASDFGKKVVEWQRAVAENNRPRLGLFAPVIRPTIDYYINDVTKISVPAEKEYEFSNSKVQLKVQIETKPLADVLKDKVQKDQLYKLYCTNGPWAKDTTVSEKDKKVGFKDATHDTKDVYIDLIKVNDELIGFNIAQFIRSHAALIHYVKLSIMNHKRLNTIANGAGKGLMLFVMHHRGFLPLEHGYQLKVLTVFEAASASSILQLADIVHYPKFSELKDYVPLIRDTVYRDKKDKLHYDEVNEMWYYEDPIAIFERTDKSTFFKTRTELAADRLFGSRIFRDKMSIIVMFECNEENRQKFYQQIQKNMAVSSRSLAAKL